MGSTTQGWELCHERGLEMLELLPDSGDERKEKTFSRMQRQMHHASATLEASENQGQGRREGVAAGYRRKEDFQALNPSA